MSTVYKNINIRPNLFDVAFYLVFRCHDTHPIIHKKSSAFSQPYVSLPRLAKDVMESGKGGTFAIARNHDCVCRWRFRLWHSSLSYPRLEV